MPILTTHPDALYAYLSCTTTCAPNKPFLQHFIYSLEKGKTRLLVFKQNSWTQQARSHGARYVYTSWNTWSQKKQHFLRAMTATCLYHAGIDEQLIMERTDHHCIDWVCSYKWMNEEQLAILSNILNVLSKWISIASQSTSWWPMCCLFWLQGMHQLHH